MTLAREWLRQALDSRRVAQAALALGIWDWACFHCNQAVEIALKAVLILYRGGNPHTHSIEHLLVECANYNTGFELFNGRAGFISRMYLATRYFDGPATASNSVQRYSEADANEALSYTDGVLILAQAQFPDRPLDSET
jgi:HEPN domain-containing protein